MPNLISVTNFRERFDISSDFLDPRIQPHIGSASRRLRKWVGDETYVNALNATTEYAALSEDLKTAEAYLTYHYAIEALNYPMTSKGIVATSQSGEGKEMRKYLSPNETAQVKMQMLEAAREIAEPYCYQLESAGLEIIQDVL